MNIVEQAREVVEGFMREPWDSPGLIEALDEAGLLRSDPPDEGEVMAFRTTGNNSHIIEDCFKLGYLTDEMAILDPTYGMGVFWKRHRPPFLIGTDLDPAKSVGGIAGAHPDTPSHPAGLEVDFTNMYFPDASFDAVVFDPDYKMQGTDSGAGPAAMNPRFGMARDYRSVAEQLGIIGRGLSECVRVTKPGGVIAVKCMDQVVSGKVTWQTDAVMLVMESCGCDKFAAFHLEGHRKQPTHDKCRKCGGTGRAEMGHVEITEHGLSGVWSCLACGGEGKVPRRQVHERRNYSTLALYRKAKS